jgi:phosphatidylserine/phosphatidylglycerophosphate/cardiolipin synthase-like enzyme
MESDRARVLREIIANESIDNIDAFVHALRSEEITLASRLHDLQRVLVGPAETSQRFRAVLEKWPDGGEGTSKQLADTVEIASASMRQISQLPRAELVWTGPAVGHPTARKTYQVLNEMLRHATSRVLIVGYSLFLQGELAKDLLAELGRLSARGVKIEFIVDRRYRGWGDGGQEGHSVRQIQEAWVKNKPRPTIYSWADEQNEFSKLHAKVILVDERDLLVTSANLTGAGMETNLELGVRLQGETARNCSEHFANLMAVNFFTLEEWP